MLPSVVIHSQSPLFADDINLCNNGPDLPVVISELQQDVNRVHDFLNERCLHVNASQTEFKILHRSPVDLNQHTLTVGNSTVSLYPSAKYLGLTIENRLTFSRHIDLLVGKIAGKLKTFQRVRNSLDNRARRSFYISLIQTSLLYGSNAFSPCLSITHVKRFITISKRAQRISFGYPPSAHTAPIRARHNLIPLDSLLLFKRLVVVFRSLHSPGSCLLDSLFSFHRNSNRTSTVTRAQVTNCLALPGVRTRSGLHSLSYTATKEWNSLPPPPFHSLRLFSASIPHASSLSVRAPSKNTSVCWDCLILINNNNNSSTILRAIRRDEGRTAASKSGWNTFPVYQDCPTAAGRTQIHCALPRRWAWMQIHWITKYCPRRLHQCAQRDPSAI